MSDSVRFTVSPACGDRVHHVTADEVRVVLSRLAPEVRDRLRSVHFNDRGRGARVLGYVNRGRREITVCACPPRMSLTRFLVRGQTPEHFGARRGSQWPGLSIRRFLLYDVLLHELGHLQIVNSKAKETRRRFADEPLAQDFAMDWCAALWAVPFDHPDPVHNPPTPAELADDDWELSDLIRLATLRPQAELLQQLGRAYRRRGRLAEARAAYERAVALAPSDGWTLLLLGNSYYAEGDWAAAADWFGRAAGLMPDRATPYWCLAEAAERQGNVKAADTYFRRAVEAEPQDRLARRKLREWQDRRVDTESTLAPDWLGGGS
jgi:hypothetical protein